MFRILLVVLCVMVVGASIHLQLKEYTFDALKPGQVSLKSDSGLYLARCNQCGPAAYPDSVGVHETNPYNPWSLWTIEVIGNKVAFKSDNGNYLTRCNNCWNKAAYQDGVFAHVSSLQGNPWSLWTAEHLGGSVWAFKADNGQYLTRCNSCVTGGTFPDFAFTHVGTLSGNPWSKWIVEYRFPLGPVTLIADAGGLLMRCTNCGEGSYADAAGIHESNQGNDYTTWYAEAVGDKIALKSDHGMYLSRCNNCWTSATFLDAAFAHVSTLDGNPWSLWTPQRLPNGKWTLRGDNGNYLARCNGCVPSGHLDNFAFVHVGTYVNNPWAQWTVKYAFPMGQVNLKGDNGMYLARCHLCGPSGYTDSVGVHEPNSEQPWALWTVQAVGNKVALKSDNGSYLTRCNNCWTSSTFPDAAFVHVSSLAGNPWSLWSPEVLPNGNWALKGDNGNYLARCNGCVGSANGVSDFAFVHVGTWKDNPWAQWHVIQR